MPATRSVAFGIWVKVGSRNETMLNNGITHLIEHMIFKGTERYSAREIAEIFDGLGGNINAFTSKENTCYFFIVLDEHLPKALEILTDMFFHSQFSEEELSKEKLVIDEEIAMYEDTPDDTVHDLIAAATFGNHPLGNTILGTQDHLKSFHSKDLKEYMEQHYTPQQIVLSIAGQFDETILDLLEEKFGNYHNSKPNSMMTIPIFQNQMLVQTKSTEQNHICLGLPGLSMTDKHYFSMNILNNIIGGGMSSRLFQEIREQRGLAYSVYSYHTSYVDSGLFVIYVGTTPQQTNEVIDVTIDVLARLKNNGLTIEELNRTKEQLKGNFILSNESSASRMNRNGRQQLMIGKCLSNDEVLSNISAVSLDDVQQLIIRLLEQPLSAAIIGPNVETMNTFRRDQLVSSYKN